MLKQQASIDFELSIDFSFAAEIDILHCSFKCTKVLVGRWLLIWGRFEGLHSRQWTILAILLSTSDIVKLDLQLNYTFGWISKEREWIKNIQ